MRLKFVPFPSVTPPDTASDHEYCIGNIRALSTSNEEEIEAYIGDRVPSE